MARLIDKRIKVKGNLITQSPLHVGGISLDPTIDLSLAVDGQGRYYIPGTSLAGAFRQWMFCNFDADTTEQLWGYQKKDQGHASFLLIEDAYFSDVQVEVRDGVGIDRHWGRAADKAKFDRAIIPKGVSCKLEMSIEVSPNNQDLSSFYELLSALCAGEIRLGAAKTRGMGRVKLEDCQELVQTLNSKKGIIQALHGHLSDKSPYQDFQPPALQKAHASQLKITIQWHPVGAVMVKDAIEGNAVDILPLTSADGDNLALVIPGSSIKGALRSQAERIVRTVINSSSTGNFLQQVKVPIVENLFGAAANKDEEKLGQGALFVDDCFSRDKMTNDAWQQVIQAKRKDKNPRPGENFKPEEELITALNNANLLSIQQTVHVAIDRWTGGAAENMLFSNLEPFGINWSEIELTVNLTRLVETKLPAIALLLLVLRDLYQQRIPLGYGVNRGMGAIAVDSINVNGRGLGDGELAELTDFSLSISAGGKFEGIEGNVLRLINDAWGKAIRSHQQGG
jgi:CRISPR/Cas system CSM-associated protein Csm3 (group 7 of RAMP superfamily)